MATEQVAVQFSQHIILVKYTVTSKLNNGSCLSHRGYIINSTVQYRVTPKLNRTPLFPMEEHVRMHEKMKLLTLGV